MYIFYFRVVMFGLKIFAADAPGGYESCNRDLKGSFHLDKDRFENLKIKGGTGKMKTTIWYSKIILAAALLLCWAGVGWAVPVSNYDSETGEYIDTYDDGTSYGTYTNSGSLLFIEEGNNEGEAHFDSLLDIMRYGNGDEFDGFGEDFELSVTEYVDVAEFDVDEETGRTGTWNVNSPVEALSFYGVKAGNAYAMYWVDPANADGSWSTFDIWASGLDIGIGGEGGLEFSHFNGYNPGPAPVPEPASMLLLGVGLAGIAGFTRVRLKKKS